MQTKGGNCPVTVVKILMEFLQGTRCFPFKSVFFFCCTYVTLENFTKVLNTYKRISANLTATFLLSHAGGGGGGGGGGGDGDDDNDNND
jgi:uncharacterized membrane protein